MLDISVSIIEKLLPYLPIDQLVRCCHCLLIYILWEDLLKFIELQWSLLCERRDVAIKNWIFGIK